LGQRTKAELLLVTVTMVWGCTFVVVKEALSLASPLPFLAARFTLAGLLLALVLRRGRMDLGALSAGAILGFFLFVGYLFQTWGLVYTTPSKSAFITGFGVVLVPFIQVFYGFHLRSATVLGAMLGFAGIYFLVLPSGLESVNRGDVLTVAGATSFAVHIVLVGGYTRRHSFRHLVPTQVLTVGALATLALPFDRHLRMNWSPGLVAAVLVTALLATGFAFSVQNWAQQFTPPAHTALIFALEPVFAALTSWLVLAEHLGGKVLLGSALILAGMVVSELWGGTAPAPVEG
jgi:drug/metabolite transporter (DMT)-like permease